MSSKALSGKEIKSTSPDQTLNDFAILYKSSLIEAISLAEKTESDSEPYKNKYTAVDVLEKCSVEGAKLLAGLEGELGQALNTCLAILYCKCGSILLDTDLTSRGDELLLKGVDILELEPDISASGNGCILQEARNSLASRACDTERLTDAREMLLKNIELYTPLLATLKARELEGALPEVALSPTKWPAASSLATSEPGDENSNANAPREQQASPSSALCEAEEGDAKGQANAESSDQQASASVGLSSDFADVIGPSKSVSLVEKQHTVTLFILAQVHGALDQPAEAAKYCGLTLERQITAGAPPVHLLHPRLIPSLFYRAFQEPDGRTLEAWVL